MTTTTSEIATFQFGDRVRVSAEAKAGGDGAVHFGQEVEATVTDLPRGIHPSYRVTTEAPYGQAQVTSQYVDPQWLTLVTAATPPATPEAHDPSRDGLAASALTVALKRAERAELALEAFKTQVSDAVIEEADRQGWCDRVDSWLEELGLPTRYGDLPRERGSVIFTTDGRTGIREDDDSQPWRLYGPGGTCSVWTSDGDVAKLHQTTLFAGES